MLYGFIPEWLLPKHPGPPCLEWPSAGLKIVEPAHAVMSRMTYDLRSWCSSWLCKHYTTWYRGSEIHYLHVQLVCNNNNILFDDLFAHKNETRLSAKIFRFKNDLTKTKTFFYTSYKPRYITQVLRDVKIPKFEVCAMFKHY